MLKKYTVPEFDEFLDKPVAYHRIFKLVAESVAAGVMLSQAHYWSMRAKLPDGWFYKTVDEWEDETGLTRYEQETARKKLKGLGFWQEELRGVPAKLHFRVDRPLLREAMVEAITQYNEVKEKEFSRRELVANERAESKIAALQRTGDVAETSTQRRCVLDRSVTADRVGEVQRTRTQGRCGPSQRTPKNTQKSTTEKEIFSKESSSYAGADTIGQPDAVVKPPSPGTRLSYADKHEIVQTMHFSDDQLVVIKDMAIQRKAGREAERQAKFREIADDEWSLEDDEVWALVDKQIEPLTNAMWMQCAKVKFAQDNGMLNNLVATTN